jgi:hypothetical protein
MAHQLKVEIPAEEIPVFSGSAEGLVGVPGLDIPGDLTGKTGGGSDQSLAIPCQKILVDPGTVIMAFGPRYRDQPAQVPVSFQVPGKENQVVAFPVNHIGLVVQCTPGDIGLTSDDWHESGLGGCLLMEDLCTEEVPVVRDGNAFHAILYGLFNKIGDLACAIQDGKLGMNMKVYKVDHDA